MLAIELIERKKSWKIMIRNSQRNLRKIIFEAALSTLKTATGTVFIDDRSAERWPSVGEIFAISAAACLDIGRVFLVSISLEEICDGKTHITGCEMV
jgi:hypothetical protein